MNKESLIESKISETGCNSIPMGLEYRFCHSIETHLRRKRSLLNFTTRKISEYAKEHLSEYKEGIRSMKYEKTVDFFKSRQSMVEVATGICANVQEARRDVIKNRKIAEKVAGLDIEG